MIEVDDFALSAIHGRLEAIWPNGREPSCCSNDGPHFTLRGFNRPVSIGQVEARLLYNVTRLLNVRSAFEIGTGFGYSSFWIGTAIARNHGKEGWLVSLDNHSEGEIGQVGLDFAVSTAAALQLSQIIRYVIGTSPQDVSAIIDRELDLAFIDGNHHGHQPATDYVALRPYLGSRAVVVWHDVQSRYAVGDALALAIKDGWSPVVFPTSCRMCICYRGESEYDLALAAFESAKSLRLSQS